MARPRGFEPPTYGFVGYKKDFNMVKQQAKREIREKQNPHETWSFKDSPFVLFFGF
jgi:hypothetical protein